MIQNQFDVIISGAGPAGLSAGILCAGRGLNVLICEKEDKPGPFPRAETVHDDPVFDQLIRPGFMKSISLYETNGRRFNSPGARKSLEITLKHGKRSIVFEWHDLINAMAQRARDLGVTFRFKSEVARPVIENNICRGIELSNGEQLMGQTIMACDGHSSLMGHFAGICYERMNSIIIKSVISGFSSDYSGFEYFFIAHDELKYAPGFPPGVVFVFPRGNGKCETGLYIPLTAAKKINSAFVLPEEQRVIEIWHNLKKNYPRLSGLMKNSKTESERVTYIPVGNLHKTSMMIPGLVFLGDAIGFLEATGASGIITSMENAIFAADFIQKNRITSWNESWQKQYNKAFQNSKIFRYVKKRYAMTDIFQSIVFAFFRTAERINKNWWFVKLVYKLK